MGQWKYPLCGCFGNYAVCWITTCMHYYTAGKVAETTGRPCILYGLMYTFLPCVAGCIVRGDIRKRKGIDGAPVMDCLCHCCCSICALIQEARETGAIGYPDMAAEGQVMERI